MTAEDQTRTTGEMPGYTDDFTYLVICGKCFELYEEGRPDGHNQTCRCTTREGERWPGGRDFNERALLCRCCGLVVLHSGSRWSMFFCRECQLLAMGADVWQHRIIFPIGRHTIMNNFLPGTPDPNLPGYGDDPKALAAGVYNALEAVSRGSDALWEWYPIAMRANLDRLGLSGDVSLRDYLSAVHEAGMSVLMNRVETFDGLCRFVRSGAPASPPDGPHG